MKNYHGFFINYLTKHDPYVKDILFMGLLTSMLLLFACERDGGVEPISFPEVQTVECQPSPILLETGPLDTILCGEISGLLEMGSVDHHGHIWWSGDKNSPPAIDVAGVNNIFGQTFKGKRGNGIFESEVIDLTPGRTYYYQAYIIANNEVKRGETRTFKTRKMSFTLGIDNNFSTIAGLEEDSLIQINTTISGLKEGLRIKVYGIVLGERSMPEISQTANQVTREQEILIDQTSLAFDYLSSIKAFPGENYFRPYLTVGDTTFYGDEKNTKVLNYWASKAEFPGVGRSRAVSFAIDGKGYVGTGWDGNVAKQDFWEYDPTTDTWTQRANFGGGNRSLAVGFAIGSKGYIGTGWNGSETKKDFWEYDPQSNSWTEKEEFEGDPRLGAVGFAIDNKGYIGTGRNGNEYKKDFWAYDAESNRWDRMANVEEVDQPQVEPSERSGAVGFAIGQMGYIGTGENGSKFKSDFLEYHTQTNTWKQIGDFGAGARSGAIGFSIGQKAYIGSGWNGNYKPRRDFWVYEPDALSGQGVWTPIMDLGGKGKLDAVGFSIGQKGYIATGWDEGTQFRNDLWIYAPED